MEQEQDLKNFNELSEKLHHLETRLQSLENSPNNLSDLKNGVRITGAKEVSKISPINISAFKLAEIYNDVPQVLSNSAIEVTLTAESYRGSASREIVLEKLGNGKYWVIPQDHSNYWLLPKGDLRINIHKLKTVKRLFKIEGEQLEGVNEFILVEPAIVSIMPSGQKWKLERRGILGCGDKSRSSKFQSELELTNNELRRLQGQLEKVDRKQAQLQFEINGDRQQLQSQLKQSLQANQYLEDRGEKLSRKVAKLEGECQQLVAQIKESQEESQKRHSFLEQVGEQLQEMKSQIEQLSGDRPSILSKLEQFSLGIEQLKSQLENLAEQRQQDSRYQITAIDELESKIKQLKAEIKTSIAPIQQPLEPAKNHSEALGTYLPETPTINADNTPSEIEESSPETKDLIISTPDSYQTIKLLYTLTDHTQAVRSLAISCWQGNQPFFASGSFDKTIKIWNLNTGQLMRTLIEDFRVNAIALSPDGKIIASGSYQNNAIQIWNLLDTTKDTLTGHTDGIIALSISPNGQFIASGSLDETIKIWDIKTREILHTLAGHNDRIMSVSISSNRQILASGSAEGIIKLWNLQTGEQFLDTFLVDIKSKSMWTVAISPDGETLAISSGEKTIELWNVKSHKLMYTLKAHSALVNCVAFTPDNQTLISGSQDRTIKLWKIGTGELSNTLTGHPDEIYCLAVSPDGKILVSGGSDRTINIWQLFP